jgi:IclR family transcriptional regulator, KDG regulon repressor
LSHIANRSEFLSSVKNALKILNSFSEQEPVKKITDLASELGIAKSTVSRLMSTLASEGYVIKEQGSQKYRLGLSVLNLAGVVTSTMDIHRESLPVLERLSKGIDETCHLVFLEGTDVVYLLKFESSHPVRVSSHVGKRNPSHCTSSGKVLLAYQSEDVVNRVIANGLIRYTPRTITNPDQLRKDLQKVKKDGYCISIEEFIEGVNTVGAPIRDYTGQVIAAITIVAPAQRMHERNIQQYVKKVVDAAQTISQAMGHCSS